MPSSDGQKTKARDHRPLVLDADFQITTFFDGRHPGNAAELESALAFVLSRYDLKVGLWDLARDPGLRESLLSPEEMAAPPSDPQELPKGLQGLATAAKERRQKERRLESEKRHRDEIARQRRMREENRGRTRVHRELWPLIRKRKWKARDDGTYTSPWAIWFDGLVTTRQSQFCILRSMCTKSSRSLH